MNQRIAEAVETLGLILKKLDSIEAKIERQEEGIKTYMENSISHLDANELLEAQQKSTRTTIALLYDEIEELHQVVMLLFQEINKK